jgi:hypothetical protein
LQRTLPRLALQPLLELRDLPHLLVRPRLIWRRTRLARRLRLRSLQHPHLRLPLQLRPYVPASRRPRLRRDLACRCAPQQHRVARPREHVLRRQRQALRGLQEHLQLCNVIRVPARLLQARGKRVRVRRRACARLARHNSIVRAARRRVVLVVRRGSVRVDRLRGSRSVLEVAADRVVATTKGQSARSVLVREFQRRSRASRSMRASQQHADGR